MSGVRQPDKLHYEFYRSTGRTFAVFQDLWCFKSEIYQQTMRRCASNCPGC
jgi:hypothetical protein